jgi:hypothetical protein
MLVTCLVALAVVGAVAREEPSVVPYPEQFQVAFESNITVTEPPYGAMPISGFMWYDWPSRQQRVDHGGGNYECVKFYHSDEACSLYFTPEGMYRVLQDPLPEGQPKCCLDMPDIHMTPPDWASGTPATYDGLKQDWYSGQVAQHFSFNDAIGEDKSEPHVYLQVPTTRAAPYSGYPLVFSFPVADGIQDYHFKPETLEEGQPHSAIFQLPAGCANVACPTEVQK